MSLDLRKGEMPIEKTNTPFYPAGLEITVCKEKIIK